MRQLLKNKKMEIKNLEEMIGGWFIGNFEPNVLRTDDVEVGVKHYPAGDIDPPHFHKLSTEITVVISGRVLINGQEFGPGKIIRLNPGEVSELKNLKQLQFGGNNISNEEEQRIRELLSNVYIGPNYPKSQ